VLVVSDLELVAWDPVLVASDPALVAWDPVLVASDPVPVVCLLEACRQACGQGLYHRRP